MNRKGSMFTGVIIALFIFMAGALTIPYFADDVSTNRVSLDCTNTSISDGQKISCLETDLTIPYFIWIFVSITFGYFGGKLT